MVMKNPIPIMYPIEDLKINLHVEQPFVGLMHMLKAMGENGF